MKKSVAFAIVLMMFASLLLLACGPTSGNDGKTYNFTVWCAEADKTMIESMLVDYEEENPSNTYSWTVTAVEEDVAGSRVIADPDTAADIFSFASDQLGKLVKYGAIAAVPSSLKKHIEGQIFPAQIAATYENVYYGYPFTYENCFLYYNKSMITSAEVIGDLEKLLTAQISGVQTNLAIDMTDSYYTTMFLLTTGVTLFGADGTDGSDSAVVGSLNNDKATKACDYILSLGDKPKFGSVAKAQQYNALFNREIAAIISGPHSISLFKSALGANFAVAKLPKVNIGGQSLQLKCFSGIKMYGVNRLCQNTDEASKIAAFLSNYDNQMIRLNDREFCPTDTKLYEEAEKSAINTVKVVIDQADHSVLKPSLVQMGDYWTPMGSFLYGVFTKKVAKNNWNAQLAAIEEKIKAK